MPETFFTLYHYIQTSVVLLFQVSLSTATGFWLSLRKVLSYTFSVWFFSLTESETTYPVLLLPESQCFPLDHSRVSRVYSENKLTTFLFTASALILIPPVEMPYSQILTFTLSWNLTSAPSPQCLTRWLLSS